MDGSQGNSNSSPPFLTKTYDMVDDPATDAIVSWGLTNNSFIVWNPFEFARDLLPKYFKHCNFSSFIRQLNTYGFRKIDPNQWEFANDEFIRGQRHLLKNIHRRKPIHSHSLQNQSSSGLLTEAERQELEEDIERLKCEKSILIVELQRYTQEQQGMEIQMQSLEERLHDLENRQRQLMEFLTQVLHRPDFLSNLIQQSEIYGKKRRLPKPCCFYDDSGVEENCLVSFQPVVREKVDTSSVLILDTEPFEKMESSLNSLEDFFRGVSHASGEMFDSSIAFEPSSLVLTELHPIAGNADVNLQSQSPELHRSPCLEDVRTSPALVESTNYAESSAIPLIVLHVERSKTSEIDVNLEPAAPENPSDPSVHDQTNRSTSSGAPTGVNDMFWEQFLTETPGSSDNQECQRESRDVNSRMADVNTADREHLFWARKNVDCITEQVGHLTPAGQT